jgi:hypothetical protein
LDAATARDVVAACMSSGADQQIEVPEALPATGDLPLVEGLAADGPAVEGKMRKVTVTFAEVDESRAAYLQRLGRELGRHLAASGLGSRIGVIWLTGGGSGAPGTRELLTEVLGAEPRDLDVLSRLQHDLDEEEAADLGPRLATAIGLALAKFGGPRGFNLRQEDLMVARGFERVKFPLAIACMVAWIALLVHFTHVSKQRSLLEYQIGSTWIDPKDPKAPPQFFGMLNSVFRSKWFEDTQAFRLEQTGRKDYTYKDLIAELVEAPVYKRLQIVRARLRAVADQKQKESGVYEDVSLESGLAVLVRFAEVLRPIEPQLGRYLVSRIDLNMKAPNRRLEFTIAFRGEDFRDRMSVLRQAIEAEFTKPDTPFERSDRDELAKEELFRDRDETKVSGAYFKITMRVKDSFEPFGPSSPTAVGFDAAPARPAGTPLRPVGGTLADATEGQR